MAKTIVVEVTRRVPHPLYKRIVTKRKKFYAHDEEGRGQGGRCGAHHRVPPDEQAEALELGEVMRKAVQVTTDLSSIGIEPGPRSGLRRRRSKGK